MINNLIKLLAFWRGQIIKRWQRLKWLYLVTASLIISLAPDAVTALLGSLAAGVLFAVVPINKRNLHRIKPGHRQKTVRRSLKKRLTLCKRTINSVIRGLPQPAILLDETGHVILHNASAAALSDLIQPGADIAHVFRAPELLDLIAQFGSDHEPATVTFSETAPLRRRFAATIVPLPAPVSGDNAAPSRGFQLITLQDSSEHQQFAKIRSDFITYASHELRTPLASLRGYVETLQGSARNDPAAQARFLGIMADQAERMTRLIDDLLSLSRLEQNAHILPETRLELSELCQSVINQFEPILTANQVELHPQLPDHPVWVQADRDELIQALQNLLQNAIKYGGDGTLVRCSLTSVAKPGNPGQNCAKLSFCDNGPGIERHHLPRLVERFYRVDIADSRRKGGTGLGLAIVKHVVQRHRGELKIHSTPGKGACFEIFLPEIDPATSKN